MSYNEVESSSKGDDQLKHRIMAYAIAHPGVKLSDIEKGVGASRTEVAEAIQELIHQGMLRKDEETREYYPIL